VYSTFSICTAFVLEGGLSVSHQSGVVQLLLEVCLSLLGHSEVTSILVLLLLPLQSLVMLYVEEVVHRLVALGVGLCLKFLLLYLLR
jgi:hypothetical protein